MYDNNALAPIGTQIRLLRQERGWTLAELARRAGTSGPTIHRYENGWDRFELATLRRIASALDARLDIRLVPVMVPARSIARPGPRSLIKHIAPLFWDHDLSESDLTPHRDWILERVLTAGNRTQVRAARAFFGDNAIHSALKRRGIDERTRAYWRLILRDKEHASQGP